LDLNLINEQGQIDRNGSIRKAYSDRHYNKQYFMLPKRTKSSSIQNWIHRLLMLPHNENNKKKESNTIINKAINNGYGKEDILHIYSKLKQRKNNLEAGPEKNKNGLYLLTEEIIYGKS
jgi:hypothetical protein